MSSSREGRRARSPKHAVLLANCLDPDPLRWLDYQFANDISNDAMNARLVVVQREQRNIEIERPLAVGFLPRQGHCDLCKIMLRRRNVQRNPRNLLKKCHAPQLRVMSRESLDCLMDKACIEHRPRDGIAHFRRANIGYAGTHVHHGSVTVARSWTVRRAPSRKITPPAHSTN